jgi:glycosyltransferase involved in cell wall biosynthesis
MSAESLDALRRGGILLVTQQLGSVRSGVGTYARTLVEGLVARGIPLTVASWDDECEDARFGELACWRLGRRPRWDPTPGAWHTLGRRAASRLGRADRRFAVVHFLDAREGHATLRSKRLRGVADRFVGTVHDDYAARASRRPGGFVGQAADPYRRFLYYAWLRRLERRTLPRFDLLATNSRSTTRSIVEVYGVDPGRCAVVPLTIDAGLVANPAQLDGAPRLLFVGGNFFRKGLDAVIDALPLLRRVHPSVVLHVVGRDPAAELLTARARRLGVGDAVIWHGRVDPEDAAAMFAAADVLVVPSRTEALGLVYLEAFAAGVPVVAGRDGGVGEIVIDGESGLQARTDGADIARLVHRLLDEPELRESVRKGGRRILAARTLDGLIDATLTGYLGAGREPAPEEPSAVDVLG